MTKRASKRDRLSTNGLPETRLQETHLQETRLQKTGVKKRDSLGPAILTMLMFLGVALTLQEWSGHLMRLPPELMGATDYVASPLPLVMEGGDPYIRALMRTISAAESNTSDPYRLLYGGQRVKDLSVHPDKCIRIANGPNADDCTTAAGRYQFLTTTWESEASKYHPNRPAWYEVWEQPSFEPVYQDWVVHEWLLDTDVWGTDLSALLREGDINQVLKLLSGTWTSLGYGIEDNSMTALLPSIYEEMLAEELAASDLSSANP